MARNDVEKARQHLEQVLAIKPNTPAS